MRKKYLKAQYGIAAIIVILFALCLSVGLWLSQPRPVYADEGDEKPSLAALYENGSLTINCDEKEVYYTGKINNVPELTLTYNGGNLKAGEDYKVLSNDIKVGTASLTITGMGNYTGAVVLTNYYNIVKADNYWTQTPFIAIWQYGSFDKNVNLITAADRFGSEVTFTIRKGTEPSEDDIEFVTENGIIVDEDGSLSEKLNGLHAGVYYLYAEVEDNDNHYGINQSGEIQPVTFRVLQADNSWIVTPGITSWKWGEFNSLVNCINAEAAYGNEGMKLAIFYESGSPVIYDVDEYTGPDPNRTWFTLGADGATPKFVLEKLETLSTGTYYLHAIVVTDDDSDYGSLGVTDGVLDVKSGFAFSVLKAENTWTTVPTIVQWSWNNFDKNVNYISSGTKLYNSDIITCGIYTKPMSGNAYNDKLSVFTVARGQKGIVSDEIAEELNKLPAGVYYLYASMEGYLSYYDRISTYTQFTVVPLQNYWETTPGIVQWTWSEYDPAINVINAKPAYPVSNAYVTYGIFTDEECNHYADVNLYNFVTVGEAQQEALKALPAGDYWLNAVTPLSDDYSALNTTVKFTVVKLQNSWTKTPTVSQWSWDQFDPSVNTITAVPKFAAEGSSVTYGIYSDRNCKYEMEGLGGFTVITTTIAAKLKALPANTYWLKSTCADGGNFSGLSTVTEFSVTPAQNVWTVSPYVLSWKYGEYDRQFNLIYAQPEYGTVFMRIYTNKECTAAVEFSSYTYDGDNTLFVLEDGLVPEEIVKELSTLSAGTYYLVARVNGANNYTDINMQDPASVPFEIQTVQNYWVTVPGLIGWSEGRFNADDNVFSGAAKHGEVKCSIYDSNDKLLYIVWLTDGEVSSVRLPNNEEAGMNVFNKLSVGSYKIVAEVAGTDNYSALSAVATFAVFEDSVGLNGIIAAVITFGVFDVLAAGACIALIIVRRRKTEAQFRRMIQKELHRGDKK